MKASIKRKIRKIISPIKRIGLKNRNFSIISNNCWGGYIYDLFGLKYLTPTIGCWFFANDYVKFINNIKYYLELDIVKINLEDSKHKDYFITENSNPMLGKLDDIEVVFVHYKSIDDAIKKWNYRKNRVNYNNLLVKFNDQNQFDEKCIIEFDKSKYKKLFFTRNKKFIDKDYTILFDCYLNDSYVLDDIKTSVKYVNIKEVLNSLL